MSIPLGTCSSHSMPHDHCAPSSLHWTEVPDGRRTIVLPYVVYRDEMSDIYLWK